METQSERMGYNRRRRSGWIGHIVHALLFFGSVWRASQTRDWIEVAVSIVLFALILHRLLYPESDLVRLLWTWRFTPQYGELQSEYLNRVAAMGVVVSIISIVVSVEWVRSVPGRLESRPMVMGVALFGLPIIAGMGLFGAITCAVKARWLQLHGKDSAHALPRDTNRELRSPPV